MVADDQAAACTRCSLNTPDTLVHWLLHCTALTTFRMHLVSTLEYWSTDLDSALNQAHNTAISHRWAAIPLEQQIQALQGEIPPLIHAMFKSPPLIPNIPATTPQPLLMHQMLRRLVNAMDAYCKHTFIAIRRHLNLRYRVAKSE